MKKIIFILFIVTFLYNTCFADSKPLDNYSYFKTMSTDFNNMKAKINAIADSSSLKVFISTIDKAYLKPQISKLKATKESLDNVIQKDKDIEIEDTNLKSSHNSFMDELSKVSTLLADNINLKEKISNTNLSSLKNFAWATKSDVTHTKKLNEQIRKVNNYYKQMREKFLQNL